MSRIEELENEIKGLENRKIALLKELEIEKQKEVKCPFKYGDEYFLLPSDGMVSESVWGNYKFDNRSFSQGNIFKTKEEAELEHDKRDLLTCFRQFRDKCNGDWRPESNKIKYYICLKCESLRLSVSSSIYWNAFNMFGYFKNKQDVEVAIELFGDEIKRLFVEVEQ